VTVSVPVEQAAATTPAIWVDVLADFTGVRLAVYDELLRRGALDVDAIAAHLGDPKNAPGLRRAALEDGAIQDALRWLVTHRLVVREADGRWRHVGMETARQAFMGRGPDAAYTFTLGGSLAAKERSGDRRESGAVTGLGARVEAAEGVSPFPVRRRRGRPCITPGSSTSANTDHRQPPMNTTARPVFVIYHRADNDGICCREIARHFLPGAELIGLDYNEMPPPIPADALLYILDLSVPSLMEHPGLVWIDHHKTAIEQYPASIRGYRIDGVAACRLAWQWFVAQQIANEEAARTGNAIGVALPGKAEFVERRVDEPLAVRLIGENDIWDHRDPRARLLNAGLRSQEIDWKLLLDGRTAGDAYVEHLLKCARYVSHAQREGLLSLMREHAFTLDWEGLKWIAVNAAGLSSDAYELVAGPEHDAGLSFVWNPKRKVFRVSMRSLRPGLDLSEIARRRGGGGHRAACGFEDTYLPFSLLHDTRSN